MKLLLLCGILLAAPAMAEVSVPSPLHAPTPKQVAVYFNRKTTFTQLANIKQDVLKDGLILEYDRLEFDKEGYLTKISFHVDCEGYTWGSATDDNLPNDYSFGFVRDFTPGAKAAFRIGNLK
jgi:hypothetical protein